MRAFSTAMAAVGLAVFLSASASAGTITIIDGANDVISFTTDSAATTARLNTANCPGAESPTVCGFAITGQTGAAIAGDTFSQTIISLLEPQLLTMASDNLHLSDIGAGGNNAWVFVSDGESGLAILANAFTLTEDGTAQLVATITYHSATGAVVGSDQIFIQSDLDAGPPPPAVPEPASASLLLLGGGLLIAAGRLRKRARG
jgi:PEP-CTERM motif